MSNRDFNTFKTHNTMEINTYYTLPVEQPWGGFKESGIGRNSTVLALEHYLEWKGVYIDTQKGPMRPYHGIVLGQ
jgi:acyl-CoA reductase-like NAD-dependent aldehyde dehydrogenase